MEAAILLAAGGSRRFGRPSKLLAPFGRGRVWDGPLRALRAAPVQRRLVVTGAEHARIARALPGRGLAVIRNRRWRAGLGTSLAAALHALRPRERWILVLLADLPLIEPAAAAALLRARRPGLWAVRAMAGRQPGHPVLLHRRLLARAGAGDAGLGALLAGLPGGRLATVAVPARSLTDVDTPAALARARMMAIGNARPVAASEAPTEG
jgi:molybdenum cofactor cytidylyltransferase